jgi:nucleolin
LAEFTGVPSGDLKSEELKVIVMSASGTPGNGPTAPVSYLKYQAKMATEDASKLFVAGLPESITEDVLRQLFEATGGTVVDVSLPRDRATGRPRGFGFVTFSTPEEAATARQSLDGSLQAGRAISVRPFSSEPPRRGEGRSDSPGPSGGASEDRTLYVGNLPYDTSQPEVTQLLADNGVSPVVRMHLPAGPDGRLRGFGFVTLASAEAANAAIVSLRGVDVRGRRLMVNIAHPRGSAPPGGGPSGPRSGGFRPPREEGGGGGWGPEPQAPDPFAPPVEGSAQARPDSRRGRPGGDEEEARKAKKKGPGGGANAGKKRGDKAERGGGGNWRSLKWDDED